MSDREQKPEGRCHSFSFSISPNGHGAFAVYLHQKSGRDALALIGQWPTIEHAEKMVTRIRERLPPGPEIHPAVLKSETQEGPVAE